MNPQPFSRYSVRLREERPLGSGLAAYQTLSRWVMLFERNRAACRARLLPKLRLAFGPAAPIDICETAAAFAFHLGAKLCVVVEAMSIGFGSSLGLLIEAFLNLVEKRFCARGCITERCLRLCRRTRHIAPRQYPFARFDGARDNFNSQRHPPP